MQTNEQSKLRTMMKRKKIVTRSDHEESRKRLKDFTFSAPDKQVSVTEKILRLIRNLFKQRINPGSSVNSGRRQP